MPNLFSANLSATLSCFLSVCQLTSWQYAALYVFVNPILNKMIAIAFNARIRRWDMPFIPCAKLALIYFVIASALTDIATANGSMMQL